MVKSKRKISVFQILRVIVQISGLIFFPGAFILIFGGIKEIYTSIYTGSFDIFQLLPRIVEVITVIPITIFLGRFFCGWLCAFGAFNDFIYAASRKAFKIKFKISERLDSKLKYIKYIILAAAVYFIWTIGSTLFDISSPWDAFAQLPNISDAATQYTIGFILLIGIVIGAMFVERFFCRYLCPLGAIFSITSRFRALNISKPRDKCGNCRICTNKCAMGIQLYKNDKVTSGECINCYQCIEACPRKNTRASMFNEDIHQLAAASIALVLFAGVYAMSSFTGHAFASVGLGNSNSIASSYSDSFNGSSNEDSQSNSSNTDNSDGTAGNNNELPGQSNSIVSQKYKDGTYIGTGRGYRPGLDVSVTIKNGKITDVQIVSDNETPRFSQWAFEAIPQEIIQSQSPDVDSVSGATRSSNGIKQAVADALSQAAAQG